MGFYEILFSFIIALFLTMFFAYGFKNNGPWGNIWSFFIILFLGIWASSFYLLPVGPLFHGIDWIPLFFIGLFFALLLASVMPSDVQRKNRRHKDVEPGGPPAMVAIGGFFWILIILLVLLIVWGYN